MSDYYINSDGILVKTEIYSGQTFTDSSTYDYYETKDTIRSVTSVDPDGNIKDVIL